MKLSQTIAAACALALISGPALAQETAAAQSLGTVASLTGPENSVLIVRGNTTYSLAAGDTLFAGDQVFTRTNGQVTLTLTGCEKTLGAASSLVIGPESCTLPVTQLASNDVVGGYAVTPPSGGVGATPALIGLALLGGGAAAAGGGGGGGGGTTPVSP